MEELIQNPDYALETTYSDGVAHTQASGGLENIDGLRDPGAFANAARCVHDYFANNLSSLLDDGIKIITEVRFIENGVEYKTKIVMND